MLCFRNLKQICEAYVLTPKFWHTTLQTNGSHENNSAADCRILLKFSMWVHYGSAEVMEMFNL